MRKLYESASDRGNQSRVIQILQAKWGPKLRVVETPKGPSWPCDALICARSEALSFDTLGGGIGSEELAPKSCRLSLLGIAEIKARKHRWGTYPSLILSLKKWRQLLKWRSCMAKPGMQPGGKLRAIDLIVVVDWEDQVGAYKFDELHEVEGHLKIEEQGGRTRATRDEWDVEDVVHIPIELFSTIHQKNISSHENSY